MQTKLIFYPANKCAGYEEELEIVAWMCYENSIAVCHISDDFKTVKDMPDSKNIFIMPDKTAWAMIDPSDRDLINFLRKRYENDDGFIEFLKKLNIFEHE